MKTNAISPASMLRSQTLENKLNRLGLQEHKVDTQPSLGYWWFGKIPRSQIDRVASINNQARLHTSSLAGNLIPENLDKMKIGMEDGAEMPAILVFPEGALYAVGDGNHRNHCSEDYTYVNAYVVNANPEVRRTLTFQANDENGEPNPEEARLIHAVQEVRQFGTARSAAARLHKVSEAKLIEQVKIAEFNETIRNEVPKSENLEDSMKRVIADVKGRTKSLVIAKELTKAACEIKGVQPSTIKEWDSAYKNAKNSNEQEKLSKDIAGWMTRHVAQKTLGGTVSPKKRLAKNPGSVVELAQLCDKMTAFLRKPKSGEAISAEVADKMNTVVDELSKLIQKRKMVA